MRVLTETTLGADQKRMGDAKLRVALTKTDETPYTYYIDSGVDKVIASRHTEQEWSYVAQMGIQDSDATLAGLDLGGYKGVIGYGYGDNYSDCAPLWVIAQQTHSFGGGIVTSLSLAGTFNLMGEDTASEAYTPDSSNTDTVKDILTAIVEATLTCYSHCKAYVATFDDTTGIIDTFMPKDSFRIYLNDTRLAKIKQLMRHVGYKCRVEADEEVHFFIPTTSSSTYDYEYDDVVTEHNFYEKSVRKRVVIPGYFVVSSHPDHEAPYKGWTGSAQDPDYDSMPDELKFRDHKYFRVTSDDQCASIAANLLLHQQMDAEKGHGYAPMNCGQEVFDYVNITDSRVGDTRSGNIGYIHREYTPGNFKMEFRFGSIAPGQYLGTMPPQMTITEGISTAALAEQIMTLWDNQMALLDAIIETKQEVIDIEPDAGIPSGGTEGGIVWKSLFDGSTDTPTSTDWVLEAGLPFALATQIYFSPIIDDPSWGPVVYIIDLLQTFWRYAFETKTFYKMRSPTYSGNSIANCYRALALSPNGTKLACPSEGGTGSGTFQATGGKRIEIYDIPTNTWTASDYLPDIEGAGTAGRAFARSVVWEDEDTLWVWAIENNGSASGLMGKCIKYVKSADEWIQYPTKYSYISDAYYARYWGRGGAAIKSDKSVVYGGGCSDYNKCWTYTIDTDTYEGLTHSGHRFIFATDRDKVWYYDQYDGKDCRQGYLDTVDDSWHDDQFAENTERTTDYGLYCGIHDDLTDIIAHASASIPRMMSAKTGGGYLLGTLYAGTWTPVLISKPDDSFAVSIINAADNVSLNFDHTTQTTLWDGTWKFYYPVAGDYTEISIKYGGV